MKAAGFGACIRYLSRSDTQGALDLSSNEANAVLGAGLALGAVQHVSAEGWSPSATLGATYGANAASNAQTVGVPPGVTVWLDLEGVNNAADAGDVIAYCNAWFAAVKNAGYQPGIYVGANCGLTGDQLFWNLQTQHYWESGSTVPTLPQRGYQMTQRITAAPDVLCGLNIDRNLMLSDSLGGQATWWCR
ncbi:DUF1906 domain-containing protein [Paraburkholderia flagellata]|uniref:DUF1906 domain-containing protein n=1 Tax=Paraburkholderia flagellata TaxID=2883241 RepID=UPI001F1E790C|nr:DUF1906 domain-containing protein [Paraburkholderia flagellata]